MRRVAARRAPLLGALVVAGRVRRLAPTRSASASSPSRSTRSTGSTRRRAPRPPARPATSRSSPRRPATTPRSWSRSTSSRTCSPRTSTRSSSRRRTPTCSSRCSRRRPRACRSCSFDSDIPDWKPKTAYVGTENEVGGEKAGKYIAELLKNRGTLAIISGIPGSEVGIQRVDGVKKGIEAARRQDRDRQGGHRPVRPQPGGRRDGGHPPDRTPTSTRCSPPTTRWRSARSRRSPRTTRPRPVKLIGFDGALEATQHILGRRHAGDDRPGPLRHGQDGRRAGARQARRQAGASRPSTRARS